MFRFPFSAGSGHKNVNTCQHLLQTSLIGREELLSHLPLKCLLGYKVSVCLSSSHCFQVASSVDAPATALQQTPQL